MDTVTWIALLLAVGGYLATKFVENLIYYFRSGTAIIESRRDSDILYIEILIFEIRDLACEYWCMSSSNPEKVKISASITGRLTFLASRIELSFGSQLSGTDPITPTLSLFHVACTGNEFHVGSREPDPTRCVDIERYAYAVAHLINVKRRNLPRRIFPTRINY